MSYKILSISEFKKHAKRLIKKHRSLQSEIAKLQDVLADNPFTGTPIAHGCYKIRLAIKSKNAGKSGGA